MENNFILIIIFVYCHITIWVINIRPLIVWHGRLSGVGGTMPVRFYRRMSSSKLLSLAVFHRFGQHQLYRTGRITGTESTTLLIRFHSDRIVRVIFDFTRNVRFLFFHIANLTGWKRLKNYYLGEHIFNEQYVAAWRELHWFTSFQYSGNIYFWSLLM